MAYIITNLPAILLGGAIATFALIIAEYRIKHHGRRKPDE